MILPSDAAVNLGVKIDSSMSLKDQINCITSKGYFYLNNFYRIGDKLTHELKVQMVTTYIIPLVDYCNVILLCASKQSINKLQKLLNSAVRFIFHLNGKKRFRSITPYLKKLHFLPVEFRIKYKLCLLVFKCVQGLAPQYLTDLLKERVTDSRLRSSDDFFLLHESTPTTHFGECAFSYAGPHEWNKLPYDLRACTALNNFKCALKTHFFKLYFN